MSDEHNTSADTESNVTQALDHRASPRPGEAASRGAGSSSSLDGGRFTPGEIVDARYRVVSLLGRGGMGEVYRAEDLRLGEVVALKFLPARLAHDAAALARLHDEVRMARRISHVNAVRVHDIGEAEGQPFLTMEYVDGEDLSSLLRRIGALPQPKAVELARQICAGLAAAHARGILHRDLKPANIMVDGEGRAKVNDFGLAIEGMQSERERGGTPAYMAPEQLAGSPASVASDVYALGLTLFEMFTGQRLIDATDADGEKLDLDATYELLRRIDETVARAVVGCLAVEPSARTADVLEVSRQLPGGDPLAAALAAGETPSPQMIAGAAVAGALSKTHGAVLLVTVIVAVAVAVWTQGIRSVYTIDEPLERQVLKHRAQTLLEGSPAEANRYDFVGFEPNELAQRASSDGRSLLEWQQLAAKRPGLVEFTYVTSPAPWPGRLIGRAWRFSAPLEGPNAARITLDGQGRLLRWLAVPESGFLAASSSSAAPVFEKWFEESDLEFERFVSVEPTVPPPLFAESLFSWRGSYAAGEASEPQQQVRVDAAAVGNQVVFWQVVDSRLSEAAVGPAESPAWIALVVALLMLGLGGLLAWRHYRSGRGDTLGATVVAVALGVITLWNGFFSGLPEMFLSFSGLFSLLALASLFSLMAWLAYMAIEPYLRRLTPRSQVSWSRLLRGRISDPILGRDFLLGVCGMSLVKALEGVVTVWLDPSGFKMNFFYPHGDAPLYGIAVSVGNLVHFTNVLVPLGLMFLIVLPRIVLSGPRFELVATWLGYLLVLAFSVVWNGPLAGIVLGPILIFLVRTGGLVALLGFGFASPFLFLLPVSGDPSVWWAPNSWLGPVVLVVLCIAAFRLATRSQLPVDLAEG